MAAVHTGPSYSANTYVISLFNLNKYYGEWIFGTVANSDPEDTSRGRDIMRHIIVPLDLKSGSEFVSDLESISL